VQERPDLSFFNLLTRRRWVHTLTNVRLHGTNTADQDIEILTILRITVVSSLNKVYNKYVNAFHM